MTDKRRPLFKAQGLCRCGRKREDSHKLCSRCRYQLSASKKRQIKILEGKSLCIVCGKAKPTKNKKYCEACAQKSAERHKAWRKQLYTEVLSHYGDKCACCGEASAAFLTLDHIHNDGAAHRRQLKMKGGYSFYRWVKKQGFPPMFQVLCWNCQNGKRIYGVCPHQSSSPVSQYEQHPSEKIVPPTLAQEPSDLSPPSQYSQVEQ